MKPIYIWSLPLPNQWSYNQFLDRQHEALKSGGANRWFQNEMMLATLAAGGRLDPVRLPRGMMAA